MQLEAKRVVVSGVPKLLWVGERAKNSPFASPSTRCNAVLFGPLKIPLYKIYRLHDKTPWLSDKNIIGSYYKNNVYPKHVIERNSYLEAQVMR